MAEATWDQRAWRERARSLSEGSGDGAELDDQARAARLGRMLAHLVAGRKLRAALDVQPPDPEVERLRRPLARELVVLRRAVDDLLTGAEPEGEARRLTAARVREWIVRERATLGALIDGPGLDPFRRLLGLDALRSDLAWFGRLLDRLEDEPGPGPAAGIEVELARVRRLLESDPRRPRARARRAVLRGRCERMRGALLERRIRGELDAASEEAAPEELAAIRNNLSRLQARVGAMEAADAETEAVATGERNGSPPMPERDDREAWSAVLSARRVEVAERIDRRLAALPPDQAAEACARIVQAARDELAEMVAFLQDAPPRRAALRLEAAEEDVDRLADSIQTLRRAGRAAPAGLRPSAGDAGKLDDALADARRMGRLIRGERRERLLVLRLRDLLGRRGAALLDDLALFLIVALAFLIVGETFMEHAGTLDDSRRALFAWLDLAICSGLMAEFLLRWALAPARGAYFLRHFVVDFLASLPFSFLAFALAAAEPAATIGEDAFWILRYARFVRLLAQLRLIMPVVRLARLGLFAARLSDRLVRKNAGLLNRNVVLFEPRHEHRIESSDRHRLRGLRGDARIAEAALARKLHGEQQDALAARRLSDLAALLETLPEGWTEPADARRETREIPVEALVDRLVRLTPETLLDRMGPEFTASVDSYIRVLDVPLVRRLPLIRGLVAHREKSPAEAVALAANYVGFAIQRGLDLIYFLADLQATLSPAIFLDRLGLTMVNATRTPAKRLLWLGSAFLGLFVVVNVVGFLSLFRPFADAVQKRLGWPVIVLGVVCLGIWALGSWLRRIANQAADFSERIVDAQFASQTKAVKARRADRDGRFLAERVVDPELALRAADDRDPSLYRAAAAAALDGDGDDRRRYANRELTFLRTVRLLHQDYLDGSPFHRGDVKTSAQLLGNLALSNLRRSRIESAPGEDRALGRLDLSRAGGLLGGPYLWFNYVTRIIVQETAILLLDYNAHAAPQERLACSPPDRRRAFQEWLGRRLRIPTDEVDLPEPSVAEPMDVHEPAPPSRRGARRYGAPDFLETVEFTAIDFLADDPARDAEIAERFGPQVARLVADDRRQTVRRAFRSFPLEELPAAQRTVNPYAFYEARLSGGRIVFLPMVVAWSFLQSVLAAARAIHQGVRQILDPRVDLRPDVPADSYAAARRKIHRMRKPVFMNLLWLRARLDVEYLGLQLPTAPPALGFDSTLEADLDFIGGSRRDRAAAERIRTGHQRRLAWTARWLRRYGWTADGLSAFLAEKAPHLANRGGEALRAVVAACVLDHDDAATLGESIEALAILAEYAASPTSNLKRLPPGLPAIVIDPRRLWRPAPRRKPSWRRLFDLHDFKKYDATARRRIVSLLRRHRRTTRGWFRVVMAQGGADPWAELRARLQDVILKADLWSDEIVVLRAVQTLAMLDVHHDCELVWSLGGYTDPEPDEPPGAPRDLPEPDQDADGGADRSPRLEREGGRGR